MREAQARCDSNEFSRWCVYWELNPFGPEVDDLRWSWLLSMFCNANRRKHAQPAKLSDFQLADHAPPAPESAHEAWESFKARVRATGACRG